MSLSRPTKTSLANSGIPGTTAVSMPVSPQVAPCVARVAATAIVESTLCTCLSQRPALRQLRQDCLALDLAHRRPARDLLQRAPAAGAKPGRRIHAAELDAGGLDHSAHMKDAKLVAVGIAEIGAVEGVAAQARRAFVLGAGGQRVGMHLVDHLARGCGE